MRLCSALLRSQDLNTHTYSHTVTQACTHSFHGFHGYLFCGFWNSTPPYIKYVVSAPSRCGGYMLDFSCNTYNLLITEQEELEFSKVNETEAKCDLG